MNSTTPASPPPTWYALAPDEVASRLQIDPVKGLTAAAEAQ